MVNAYLRALRLAPEAVYRETGYQLGQVIDSLLPGLLQMLAVLGISTMAGAGAGAAIGFFLGGVGAAPGAAVGATLGLETGTAVLTWMGLGFLVVAIGQGMGELTGVLRRGISQAWHAPEHHFPYFEIDRAAEDLARAVGILFRLILQGLLAYVLKNGAIGASRAAISTGQTRNGTRAAADETLAEVSALLRSSKLPDGFVVWLERNWEDLQRNPKLISNKTGPTASSQALSPAATPSELKAMKERQGSEDGVGKSGNESQPVAERTTKKSAAQRLADKVQGLTSSQRPNTVAVIKHKNGMVTIGRNQGGIQNSTVQSALDKAPQNRFEGQCAEINAISRALNKGRSLDGAEISVSNVRGAGSKTGVHGTPKPPCITCADVIDQFNINTNN